MVRGESWSTPPAAASTSGRSPSHTGTADAATATSTPAPAPAPSAAKGVRLTRLIVSPEVSVTGQPIAIRANLSYRRTRCVAAGSVLRGRPHRREHRAGRQGRRSSALEDEGSRPVHRPSRIRRRSGERVTVVRDHQCNTWQIERARASEKTNLFHWGDFQRKGLANG